MSNQSWQTWLRSALLAAAALCLAGSSALAQRERAERSMTCDNNWSGDRASHCFIKEQTLQAAGGTISVDGRKNGGVSVKGWDRGEILVRAKIQAYAKTEAEAQELAGRIQVETAGAQIRSEGPPSEDHQNWGVSFEVFVPFNSDLALKARNGGISVSDVRGRIEFDGQNGGVALKRVGGSVRGQTVNGGLSIELAGDRWDGEGLDVKTMNGGVSLSLPDNYSARLETSTVNGSVKVDFPVTVQGRIEKNLSLDLGSGGAMVRAVTTNGGVSIKRRG
jgi:Toastrack DUF4097